MSGRLLLALALLSACASTRAADVPATCAERNPPADPQTPVPELRQRFEALGDTDPFAALDLICANLPRVALEYGTDSVELALWRQALATPLIAYLNRFAEADALLMSARPILERSFGPSSPQVAEIHVAYAWMAYRRGQLEEAARNWSSALVIREQQPGKAKIELQKVLVGLAQVRSSQRRFAEAKQLAARAFAILEENGETVSEAAAAIKNLMANIALREESFVEARRHAEEQIAIELKLRELGGPDQPVTAYATLGQILQRLDEYEEAEHALREAVRLAQARDGPLQRNALTALLQLSVLLNERGNPREAAYFADLALQLGERELGPAAPNLVPVVTSLAEAERARGDLSLALRLYERAAGIVATQAADVQRQVRVRFHRGYGSLLLEVGDSDAAERELWAADALSREDATLSIDRATALVVLSGLLRTTDPGAAQDELEAALGLYRARLPEEHPLISRVVNEICGIDIDGGDARAPSCDEASRRLRAARNADPSLRQAMLQNQSELARLRGDVAQMQSYALESLAAALTLGTPDPLWKASFQVARALRDQGQGELAIFFGKESIDQIQQLRRSLLGADARLDPLFIRDKIDVYRQLADWLMEGGRLDEALEVLDLLKSEELAEFLVRAEPGRAAARVSRSPAEQALGSLYDRMTSANAGTGTDIDELARLRETGRITPAERARLEQLLASQPQAEALRVEGLADLIAANAAGRGAKKGRERAVHAGRLADESRRLGPDAALAVYLLTEDRLRILVATGLRQVEYTTAVDAAELRRDIGRLLDDIANRREITDASRRLYEQLARPVDEAARAAGATRLILWPDGALRYVPFAALGDGAGFLIDRYSIQLYTGAAPATDGAAHDKGLTVRGFGVTKALGGYTALPSMADELCSIVRGPITGLESPGARCAPSAAGVVTGAGALPGLGYADGAFTMQRFSDLLGQPRDYSVLHVGTHFALRPGNAARSFLMLGDGSRFTLDQLAGVDLADIELMTLSACQTGLGGAVTDDGREVEGLAALVQKAGAARVIASLWRVEDRSTALLMGEFYHELAESRGASAAALRAAQLAMRERVVGGRRPYRHPYYWAGFTLAATTP